MSYRDDLQAAHNRIVALEGELREARQTNQLADGILAVYPLTPSARVRAHGHPPQVQPVRPTSRSYIPITFSAKGEAGAVVTIQKFPYTQFRGDELFAMDTSSRPGHGTSIEGIFIGSGYPVLRDSVPTWMFCEWLPPEERKAYEIAAKLIGTELETAETRSAAARLRIANAAMKLKWQTCDRALAITFSVRFHEACKWEAVLWGEVVR